jgi:heptosyltransferase II
MALPLLRALRLSRPDAELTLVAKKTFLPLLESWDIADRVHPLPPPGAGYYRHFRRLRTEFPDVWLLFTNSFRGDLEAWLTGCPQRFGVVRPGKPRPLLTHAYRLPGDFDENTHHQSQLWENFLRNFGLAGPLVRTPIPDPQAPSAAHAGGIGLIPGSENNPEKRWPVAHWRALIDMFPGEPFVLFGTAADSTITRAVASGFPANRVRDLAGQTDLVGFARELRGCRALITNDTGGMHLANALGVPLVALFGPTNPVRTGPVFASLARVLQPAGCPPTGGHPLDQLRPETVAAALRDHLSEVRGQTSRDQMSGVRGQTSEASPQPDI